MGLSVTPRVLIDTNGDGRYDLNAGPDVVSFNTDRGRDGQLGIANVGTARIVVKSRDARYYLDRAAAIPGLARGRRIKIQVRTDDNLISVFTGRIADIKPVLSQTGHEAFAEITCEDHLVELADRDIDLELQHGKRIDRLIRDVLREGRFGGETSLAKLTNHVPWSWFEDISALAAIEELVEADGGTFFIDRNGRAAFHSRRFRPAKRQTSEMTLDDFVVDYEELPVSVYSEVRVQANRLRVRKVQELWAETQPFKMKPGAKEIFYVDFGDPVYRLRTPDRTKSDWIAVDPNNKNTDRASSIEVTVTRTGATRARVKVKNTSGSLTVKVLRVRLRGKPIRPRHPVVARARATDLNVIGAHRVGDSKTSSGKKIQRSIEGEYHYRRWEVDSQWIQTLDAARDLARWLRNRLKTPQPRLALTLRPTTENNVKNMAQFDVSSRVSYANSVLGFGSRDFWVERVMHSLEPGGQWRTRVELTPTFTLDANRRVGSGKVGAMKVS